MLRTQEAALYNIGGDGMAALCEAICLDAVDVVDASRVSIWFFDAHGDLVCERLLDARDGRFQQGAVIPRSATQAYIDAAGQGLASMVTEDAPVHGSVEDVKARLDLLLVDSHNRPAAIFRVERNDGGSEWRNRDITILRNMAQTLASAVRQRADHQDADMTADLAATGFPAMGSVKQDLSWLRRGTEPSIWLQSVDSAHAFDALGLKTRFTGLDADGLFDADEDDAC